MRTKGENTHEVGGNFDPLDVNNDFTVVDESQTDFVTTRDLNTDPCGTGPLRG